MTYTMDIEKPVGVVKQHGPHLGTDKRVAEQFVLERLRTDPAIISICLRRDGVSEDIYDFRDVSPSYEEMMRMEDGPDELRQEIY